jgi:protein-S-isoprenylcysteine O-methyltransferase Ste14
MASNDNSRQKPEPIDRRRLITSSITSLLFLALCLFVPAGTWAWFRGWLFLVVVVAASVVITVYLRRVNPDVVAARINRHEGTKRWDLFLGIIFLLPTMLAIPIVAALDDGRFHWIHVPWWGCLIGYILLMVGMAGVTWAESVNRFFEPSVRIQTDRGHIVIDTGPYAIVRHPGYVSGFLVFIGMPVCLGSLWALIPAFVVCLLLVLRTMWEDRLLQEELPGYKSYAQRVRYRLFPGVW